VAGLISGAEHITLRQARRYLYDWRRSSGGWQPSTARMSVRVHEKQFVVHLWTFCQKAESLLVTCTVGSKVSAPSLRMGNRTEDAKREHRKGGRPIPAGESLLTATKAAWALGSLLVKCGVVEIEGVNQYPSQQTSSLRETLTCLGGSRSRR